MKMNRLDVLKDGPFRYIHCTETCQLLITLVRQGRKFIEDDGDDKQPRTLRQWKAILVRRYYPTKNT